MPIDHYPGHDESLDAGVGLLDLLLKCGLVGIFFRLGLEEGTETFLAPDELVKFAGETLLARVCLLEVHCDLVTLGDSFLKGGDIEDLSLDPVVEVVEGVLEALS